jgi:predicted Zn-dependent protease
MGEFFSRLETETRYAGSGAPEFLRTHPVTTSRIAEAENRASLYPIHHRQNSFNYLLVKARLRLLKEASSPDELLKQIENEHPSSADEQEVRRYLTALIQEKRGNTAIARKILTELRKQHPSRIAYIHALASLEENQGNYRQADNLYNDALHQYPGNPLLLLASAHNLVTEQSYDRARTQLEELLRKEPDNGEAYKLLAKLESACGNKAASYLAQAEYYYLNGEPHSALDQLNMAKRLTPLPHYYASRIDARLKRLKDEMAQTKLE